MTLLPLNLKSLICLLLFAASFFYADTTMRLVLLVPAGMTILLFNLRPPRAEIADRTDDARFQFSLRTVFWLILFVATILTSWAVIDILNGNNAAAVSNWQLAWMTTAVTVGSIASGYMRFY